MNTHEILIQNHHCEYKTSEKMTHLIFEDHFMGIFFSRTNGYYSEGILFKCMNAFVILCLCYLMKCFPFTTIKLSSMYQKKPYILV